MKRAPTRRSALHLWRYAFYLKHRRRRRRGISKRFLWASLKRRARVRRRFAKRFFLLFRRRAKSFRTPLIGRYTLRYLVLSFRPRCCILIPVPYHLLIVRLLQTTFFDASLTADFYNFYRQ